MQPVIVVPALVEAEALRPAAATIRLFDAALPDATGAFVENQRDGRRDDLKASSEAASVLRDDLIRQVTEAVPDAILNGPPPGPGRLPGNAHFSFPGCEGDALLMLLDARDIACSTGSACTAGVAQPSHVLLAMGADEDRARGSLRFSLGHTSTQEDVDALGAVIGEAVERSRRAASR